jgi:hypothetical protein
MRTKAELQRAYDLVQRSVERMNAANESEFALEAFSTMRLLGWCLGDRNDNFEKLLSNLALNEAKIVRRQKQKEIQE